MVRLTVEEREACERTLNYLGDLVHNYRRDKLGLPRQADLAERCGLHLNTISNIESGAPVEYTMKTYRKLAGGLEDPKVWTEEVKEAFKRAFQAAHDAARQLRRDNAARAREGVVHGRRSLGVGDTEGQQTSTPQNMPDSRPDEQVAPSRRETRGEQPDRLGPLPPKRNADGEMQRGAAAIAPTAADAVKPMSRSSGPDTAEPEPDGAEGDKEQHGYTGAEGTDTESESESEAQGRAELGVEEEVQRSMTMVQPAQQRAPLAGVNDQQQVHDQDQERSGSSLGTAEHVRVRVFRRNAVSQQQRGGVRLSIARQHRLVGVLVGLCACVCIIILFTTTTEQGRDAAGSFIRGALAGMTHGGTAQVSCARTTSSSPLIDGWQPIAVPYGPASEHRCAIAVRNTHTGEQVVILTPDEMRHYWSYTNPIWSPSTHQLYYIAVTEQGQHDLWLTALRDDGPAVPPVATGPQPSSPNCGSQCEALA